jgi:hypothetical protein
MTTYLRDRSIIKERLYKCFFIDVHISLVTVQGELKVSVNFLGVHLTTHLRTIRICLGHLKPR